MTTSTAYLERARQIPLPRARSTAEATAVRVTKRCIDILCSSLGLLATAVLFPIIALAIKLDSSGPVFYRQRRALRIVGRDARGRIQMEEFFMLKFRSMVQDAERHTGVVLAQKNDPRVTRVGRFLRKTRLDELPQLWNVFIGQMTLIGPRPERPELLANLALAIPYFEERMHGVKPGVTGFAQVMLGYDGGALDGTEPKRFEDQLIDPFQLPETRGSEADQMRMKLLFDLAYVATLEHFWPWLKLELAIIFKTPLVMLGGVGR